MLLTFSAVLFFAVIVVILLRTRHLSFGPALAAILLGFFLASTGIAPTIRDGLTGLADLVGRLNA